MTLPSSEARKRRRAKGLCTWCASPSLEGRALCARHAEIHRQQRRAARLAGRRVVTRRADPGLLAKLSPQEKALYLAQLAKPPAERWR